MPELPEVERAARRLAGAVVGRRIVALELLHPALLRRVSPSERSKLRGAIVERVERRGKHQVLHLADGGMLHVHFRMAGDWHVGRASDAVPRNARASLVLDDGTRVSLVDPRALSTISMHPAGTDPLPLLGPEATDRAFTAAVLRRALASKRGPIKPALLDQRVVAGLGNIYAAEALWYAKLSPRAAAASLGPRELTRLVNGIRRTLREASRLPGRYTDGDPEGRLAVYGREGEPCKRCRTPIKRIVQAGRSTYFCPTCQSENEA
jgi:formamidopyrimidine-DNA glycosylase